MNIIKNNRGYTLVEILAAVVIIALVLTSFYQLFIHTNRTAASNNEKLVTINLADAALAKLQTQTYKELQNGTLNDYLSNSEDKIVMNGKTYKVTYTLSQNTNKLGNSNYSEKDLKLIKVVVTVTAPDGKSNGSSEGYIRYE